MCIPGLRTATLLLYDWLPADRALLLPAARSSPTRTPQTPPSLRAGISLMGAFRAVSRPVSSCRAFPQLLKIICYCLPPDPHLFPVRKSYPNCTTDQHTVINARTHNSRLSSKQVGGTPDTHPWDFHFETRPDFQVDFLSTFILFIKRYIYTNVRAVAVSHN